MIPPILIEKAGALIAPLLAKISSPLVKWGVIIAVLLFSNLWTWHSTKLNGERAKAEAVAEQAKAYSRQTSQITESREEALKQLDAIRREKDQKIIDIQKRLVTYERNAKKSNVPVPPDSIGMFNAISGLLPTENHLPGTNPSTGKPDESPEARIEVTRLLLAYVRAYADCGGELKSLWDDYEALVSILRKEYTIKKDGEK